MLKSSEHKLCSLNTTLSTPHRATFFQSAGLKLKEPFETWQRRIQLSSSGNKTGNGNRWRRRRIYFCLMNIDCFWLLGRVAQASNKGTVGPVWSKGSRNLGPTITKNACLCFIEVNCTIEFWLCFDVGWGQQCSLGWDLGAIGSATHLHLSTA